MYEITTIPALAAIVYTMDGSRQQVCGHLRHGSKQRDNHENRDDRYRSQ